LVGAQLVASIATIGYEGCVVDAVVNTLRESGVELLIDVRAVPSSRKPGFSKRQLAASLDQAGIAYVHLQRLGTPKAGRDAARAGKPDHMETIFREHMTSDLAQAALADAKSLARERRACLLCFERDHMACHRRLVAEMITAETAQAIVHLRAPLV
jgi:uncharacterized protein (DUF488 family)